MHTDHIVALMSTVLRKANNLIVEELTKRGHTGLVPSHGAILARLFKDGPQPMSSLAKSIGRKKNTVTTLVKKLESEGYVTRAPSPHDSRVSLVSLTPQGEAFRPDFKAISETLLHTLWGHMPIDERVSLMAGLENLSTNLN